MMKRIAAVAAISVAAMQVLAGFTSVAMATHDGPGRHLGNQDGNVGVTGSAACTVAAGIAVIQDDDLTATVWTDGTYLYCDVNGDNADDFAGDPIELADVTSVIVYSNDGVSVWLEQAGRNGGGNDRPANFGGLKLTVDTGGTLGFDARGLETYYGGNIVLTDTSFSGQGLVGTIYFAVNASYEGGNGPDSFDASKVSADIAAHGYGGNDTLRSGSGDDDLAGEDGNDKLFGGAGYDDLDCDDAIGSDPGNDQCWAGPGDDKIAIGGNSATDEGLDVVAPGDGYDVITGNSGNTAWALTYSDSSVAVEFDGTAVYTDTGDDTWPENSNLTIFTGSPKADYLYSFFNIRGGAGADLIVGTAADPDADYAGIDYLRGGGGKDRIRSLSGDDMVYGDSGADTVRGGPGNDSIYGGGGDDVLYGLGGVDFLKGGTGIDQTWGGSGIDTCSGEVRDSCEFRKG